MNHRRWLTLSCASLACSVTSRSCSCTSARLLQDTAAWLQFFSHPLYPHINCVPHLVREVILDLNLLSSDVSLRSRALCATTSSCRLQNTHHHYQFQQSPPQRTYTHSPPTHVHNTKVTHALTCLGTRLRRLEYLWRRSASSSPRSTQCTLTWRMSSWKQIL